MAPRLSIVIVSFNTKDLLERCLTSLRAAPPPVPFETIVVDNASDDGSPDMVERTFPDVCLIRTGANLGFGAANNRGLQAAEGELILFLNSDTELFPGLLAPLLARLETEACVGIVGPTEETATGIPYPTICPTPGLWYLFLTHTGLRHRFYRSRWLNSYRQIWEAALDRGEPLAVDWISGASLMVRRAVLDRTGAFDEGYFMYMEETDLCERARAAGWRVEYVPRARLLHHGGGSSGQAPGGLLTLSGAVSELRFFDKHRSRLSRLGLKVLLIVENLLKLLLAAPADPRRWAYREILKACLGGRPAAVTKDDLCRR